MAAKRPATERTASPIAAGFEGKLRCDSKGNVVYMVVHHDFVEALLQAMHMSLGGLALSLQGQVDIMPVQVIKGLHGLRDELWNGDKASMLPSQTYYIAKKPKVSLPAEKKTACQICLKMRAEPGFAASMAAKYHHQALNTKVLVPAQVGATQFQPVDACQLCQREPTAPDCLHRHCRQCSGQVARHYQQYQAVVSRRAVAPPTVPTPTPNPPNTPVLKSVVSFIVTNKLEVFENDDERCLQLLGQAGVAIDQIQTKMVIISQDRFKMMLGCMLLNSDTILTTCFKK